MRDAGAAVVGAAVLSAAVLSAAVVGAALLLASAAQARDSLGVFDDWAAFRDAEAARCYAIATPVGMTGGQTAASVGFWPRARLRAQVQIRLTRPVPAGGAVVLTVGARRFALLAAGPNAWARDAAMDAAIIGAMRSAPAMQVATPFGTARWRLRGAASAIDAAALGCAGR